MNPLRWGRAHQLAALIACFSGALIGILFAWMRSPFRWLALQSDYSETFLFWLQDGRFWRWPVLGAIGAAVIVCAAEWLRQRAGSHQKG